MNENQNAIETVWGWIKINEPAHPNPHLRFQFTAQQISEQTGGTGINPHVLDALWQLVNAGILMPSMSTPQFQLSGWGEQAIKQDTSPYQKHEFLTEIQELAPQLDPDSLAYLSLGLDCIHGIPAATLALVRVALEIEVDSVIGEFIRSQTIGNHARRNLSDLNISTRVEELLNQLRNRNLASDEEIKLFESYANQIRISGNRILHPKSGALPVDPLLVQSVTHAFRSFASIASGLKAQLK